ncbi:MAG TPA: hypothetical protein VGL63_15330 [Streptosporangiaceae bacterium]
MSIRQASGRTLTRRTAAVAVIALASAALAGSGAARASTVARASTAAGTITTVAGGTGGPAKATRMVIQASRVSFGGGDAPARSTACR